MKVCLKFYHKPTKVDALTLYCVKRLSCDTEANWKTLLKCVHGCDDLNIYVSVNH